MYIRTQFVNTHVLTSIEIKGFLSDCSNLWDSSVMSFNKGIK